MLTCIACTKHLDGSLRGSGGEDANDIEDSGTPRTKESFKTLTSQIKDMALKVSGAYRHCKPCSVSERYGKGRDRYADSDGASEGFHYTYQRAGSTCSTPPLRSGDATPRVDSMSNSTREVAVFMAEEPGKEWVAQIEPGILITFLSLPHGGNGLKRIRFSREMYNKWQAQRWWAENYDKVMELYNVQRFNRQAFPLPTPPRSEDEGQKIDSVEGSPTTPPLHRERLPRNLHRPVGMSYSSSDSVEHHPAQSNHCDSGIVSTPNLSSISAKTETSWVDASRMSSSREEVDHSGELSVSLSNASDQETEWVEQDEPGVYITIRLFPGGTRELRRVRFSRERFSEMHARLWWEQNRARIREQYL